MALVDVREAGARIWASTQAQSRVQELVSEATGLDQETIEVVPTLLGGGFGRKLGDVAVKAARLSKGSGVPVHLGWNRPEELKHGFFRADVAPSITGSFRTKWPHPGYKT